jgi:enoyl-CoA hydratase
MSAVPLRVEDVGAVRVVTLDNPASRNALSTALNTALHDALYAADADPAVQVVVLTGSDPAFCAGVDLTEAAARGADYFAQFETVDGIGAASRIPKPIVGAVNGAAFTGGLELALGCDFLIASERAVFADTHMRVGVIPGGGMTARLPHLVGAGWARRMSMAGEVVDAATALRIGLVTEVTPHAELLPRALGVAAGIAGVPSGTMLALKQIYATSAGTPLAEALAVETRVGTAHPPEYDRLEDRR